MANVVAPRRSPRIACRKALAVRAALDGLKRFHECFDHLPPYDEDDERTFEPNAKVIKLRKAALELVKSLKPLMKGLEDPPAEYYRGHITPLAWLFSHLRYDIKTMKTVEDVIYIFAFTTEPWERYLTWLLKKLA
jgi:hypothetical protein